MKTTSKSSAIKRLIKPVIYINAIIAFGAICFFFGAATADCNINKISEVHVTRSKYIELPSFYFISKKKLADTLKTMQPPYSERLLTSTIADLKKHHTYFIDKYFKILSVDSLNYKILISPEYETEYSPYYLLKNGQTYYLKPLTVIEEIRDFSKTSN